MLYNHTTHRVFAGNNGFISHCFVTTKVNAVGDPICIVSCPQASYYGQSIMNAHEPLRKSITSDLISHDLDCISPQNPLRLLAFSECNWTDLLLTAARQPGEARQVIAKLGLGALSAIRKYNEMKNAIQSKYTRLIWIEHYPPGTFFHRNNNTHLIVKWSGNTQDTPHWRQLDNAAAIEHTGLPLSELTPDHDFLLRVRA